MAQPDRGPVRATLPDVQISRPDEDLLTVNLGTRTIVVHVVDDVAILAPSFAAGGTIGSRPQDRVQHLEMTSYGLTPEAAGAAAAAALEHLRSGRPFFFRLKGPASYADPSRTAGLRHLGSTIDSTGATTREFRPHYRTHDYVTA